MVHLQQLLVAARQHQVNVRLRPRVGEHVAAGTTLAWIWPPSLTAPAATTEQLAPALESAVRIGFERTLEQDPGLGLRQLVDAACKALSPAVNDPYTAIQAVEHLSVLYAALAAHGVGSVVARDADGAIAVAVPGRSLAEHLALGFGLIRRYGAAEPTVVQALLRPLSTVLTATDNDPAASRIIEGQAELLLSAAQRKVAEPADLDLVTAEADSLRQALASHQADTWQPGTPPPT